MPGPIHLDPNAVPEVLRGNYTGRKYQVQVTERVHIPTTAGLWDGGSRDTYRAIRIADGREIGLSDQMNAPWSAARQGREVILEPGVAVIRHSIIRGKDAGLLFYLHRSDAAPLLPAKVELTDLERKVLNIIGAIKSTYRRDAARRDSISDRDYDTAVESLRAQGLVNKAGAITVAGKNAR